MPFSEPTASADVTTPTPPSLQVRVASAIDTLKWLCKPATVALMRGGRYNEVTDAIERLRNAYPCRDAEMTDAGQCGHTMSLSLWPPIHPLLRPMLHGLCIAFIQHEISWLFGTLSWHGIMSLLLSYSGPLLFAALQSPLFSCVPARSSHHRISSPP